jgi:hypothetical protein
LNLLKQFLKDATNFAPRFPLDREPNKKKTHVCPSIISGSFLLLISSRRMMQFKLVFWKL